ncbi:hypothetical protein NE850_31470 [Paraburkholderia sp. USG1]|uniref:hypothetical protein n=1 Tax=Paraburkholderia sp. USG1 TaxID=2952268 RepID=UPI002862D57A|nr:hypothetical protein [Paraburkholderia sp. USG1]MDR8400844.1 hypothetical protein [Paraburkholderia sp. USG1]
MDDLIGSAKTLKDSADCRKSVDENDGPVPVAALHRTIGPVAFVEVRKWRITPIFWRSGINGRL